LKLIEAEAERMKRISMLTFSLIAAIVAVAIAQGWNTESKTANPTQGKFGPTLLKVGTRYYINRDYGNSLRMEHYGFIDLKGKVVIEPQWDEASDFVEGYSDVKRNDKRGWIDKRDLYVEPSVTAPLARGGEFEFNEGLARFEREGKTGFIDRTGKIVIEPEFEEANDFSEGLAAVKRGSECGWIGKSGKLVRQLPPGQEGWEFHGDLGAIKENGKIGYIDRNGRVVIKPEWDDIAPYTDGLALVRRDKKCGFIDKSGKVVVPLEWDDALPFFESLALVYRNGKRGFVDTTGKVVIQPQWEDAASCSERLLAVKRNGKWGFIDKTGKQIVEPEFEDVRSFRHGLAAVKQNGKWGLIDRKKHFVIEPEWDVMEPYQADAPSNPFVEKDTSAPVYWLVARDMPDKADFPETQGSHILVKWLDSAGKEIWSFEQAKPSLPKFNTEPSDPTKSPQPPG
jgi:WG containing repeat